jgi:hypothetical protein
LSGSSTLKIMSRWSKHHLKTDCSKSSSCGRFLRQ